MTSGEQEVADDGAGQQTLGHGQPQARDLRAHDPQHRHAHQTHPGNDDDDDDDDDDDMLIKLIQVIMMMMTCSSN